MAQMIDKMPNKPESERVFYTCVANNLPQDIICYHNREVNGMEFDFCLLVKNFGIVIIEVKGWRSKDIIEVKSPDEIITSIYSEPQHSPKKQANGYRFNLINILQQKYGISPLILDMVCYPYMSEMEYRQCGLNIVSEEAFTLFREDIEDGMAFAKKLRELQYVAKQVNYDKMNKQVFNTVRNHFENLSDKADIDKSPYSQLSIFPSQLRVSNIENIIRSYFAGTKQIIFLQNKEDMEQLAANLSNKLKEENISITKGGLTFEPNGNHVVNIVNSKLSLFNFECFLVEELSSICNKEIHIFNGLFANDEITLKELSEKTDFNFNQYKIEHAPTDKHIVVKAGAGTGKTYSMISRISFICHTSSNSRVTVPSEEIAMLTFTDDAAGNMKNRLKAQFMNYFVLTQDVRYLERVTSIERMQISTIHSFAKGIMKSTSLPLGVGADFATVNGDYERKKILRRVLNVYLVKKNKEDKKFLYRLPIRPYDLPNFLLRFIDVMQNKGFDLINAKLESFGVPDKDIPCLNELIIDVAQRAEIEYAKFLRENNKVNLRQYIIYLKKCITDKSFNKNLYKFKQVFIDEFQDVDDSQVVAFLELQKIIGFNFFIVGDLKQSIYRFRGATMDAFTKMGCDSKDWAEYTLNINYRTDKRLLEEFEPLFKNLGDKQYLPYDQAKDILIGLKCSDVEPPLVEKIGFTSTAPEEQNGLYEKLFEAVCERKEELIKLSQSQKLSPAEKTIAILVRTNSQIANIMRAAKSRDILIESDTTENLYQLQSTLDLCKLTSALINPYNQLYLFDLLSSNNVSIKFPLEDMVGLNEQQHVEKIISYLDDYFDRTMKLKWAEIIQQAQQMPILMVLRNIYEATMPWKAFSSDLDKQIYYRTNYEMIFEQLSKSNSRNYLTLDSVNQNLLIAITAHLDSNARRLADSQDYIKIICTTIHKSKGLEYDSVFLPFTYDNIASFKRNAIEAICVDDNLGYYVTLNNEVVHNNYFDCKNETLEICREESRILYVAMTRAINKFVWLNNESKCGPSWAQFLEDIQTCQ